MHSFAKASVLLGLMSLMSLMSACVISPRDGYREGYYDHQHNRYYHEHTWHDCGDHDEHCR